MSELENAGPAEAPTTEQMIESVKDGSPAEGAPAGDASAAPAPTWKGDEWAFDASGKKVIPDSRDKLMTWASQGYNYSQRMHALNQQQATWQQKLAAAEAERTKLSRYGEIDTYAAQNPEWWKHVQGQYEQRGTFNVPPEVAPLVQRLEQTEGVLKQWQEAQEVERTAKADQWLDSEIGEFKKACPQFDLGAIDESTGKSLELRILEHANEIGATSFRAAARDYLHDKLIENARAEARSAVAKSAEAAKAKGILGTSPAPTRGMDAQVDHRNKTYSQLAHEAIAALVIQQ